MINHTYNLLSCIVTVTPHSLAHSVRPLEAPSRARFEPDRSNLKSEILDLQVGTGLFAQHLRLLQAVIVLASAGLRLPEVGSAAHHIVEVAVFLHRVVNRVELLTNRGPSLYLGTTVYL